MDAPQPANRALSSAHILGWDFLRGLCALAVAAYHLMSWLEVAHWHSLGTHGVYIFFVLSGASLAYTYSPQINARSFDFPGFLFLRYFRLAPLFLLLVALSLPWKLHKDGFTLALITDVMLNATFLFGIYQPIQHSLLVGGWSLGIEVVFYMAFPLMLATLRRPVLAIGLFVCLLVVQASWIAATVGSPDGYEATLVAYHHAPAFAAYFFVGCIIGWRRRFNTGGQTLAETPGWVLLVLGLLCVHGLSPEHAGDQLMGWRGVSLAFLCPLLVDIASRIQWRKPMAKLAQRLGDATYGVYLIHPVIYFGLTMVALPLLGMAPAADWSTLAKLVLAVVVLVCSWGLALISEYHFERPLRNWSKTLLSVHRAKYSRSLRPF